VRPIAGVSAVDRGRASISSRVALLVLHIRVRWRLLIGLSTTGLHRRLLRLGSSIIVSDSAGRDGGVIGELLFTDSEDDSTADTWSVGVGVRVAVAGPEDTAGALDVEGD
jgi:hypothetical protein